MEVNVPLESALAYTGSSPTYIYSAWVTATAYAVGDMRRYVVSTGVWRDFRCKIAHTSSSSNAPGKTVYTWCLLASIKKNLHSHTNTKIRRARFY